MNQAKIIAGTSNLGLLTKSIYVLDSGLFKKNRGILLPSKIGRGNRLKINSITFNENKILINVLRLDKKLLILESVT